MRKSVLPWLACAVIALIAIPAFASGAALRGAPAPSNDPVAAPTVTFKTASSSSVAPANGAFVVGDNFFHEEGQPMDDNVVEINGGERVTFTQLEFARGEKPLAHNVVFDDEQPSSCIQTQGDPIDPNTTAPLPDLPSTQWSGYCTFQTGGEYSFYCMAHTEMTGIVRVTGNGTPTPTPTVTTTPTQTATATATATPPTGRQAIIAKDGSSPLYWFQDASNTNPADNSVTVKVGDTVDFSYPTGPQVHNVEFRRNLTDTTPGGNGPQPTCVQTSGINTGAVPPLPRNSLPAGWAGNCTFNEPGTFTFVCQAHAPAMQGSVVVESTTPTAPETAIDSGPTGTTNQTTANFTFSSTPAAGTTFECKLDRPAGAGTYAACTSPASFTTAADGNYTFSVRAVLSGTPDPTPATRSFTVDTGPPDTTINSGPQGAVNTTSQSFQFSGTESGLTFECRLDTPAGQGTYATCSSPASFTTTANGAYTFNVRARDAAGNVDPTPATRAFTVDTVAPDTTITSGPTGTTNNASPSFEFTSSEANSTFECRLDGPGSTTGTYVACTSPRAVGPLADGTYTFNVRARDAAGNQDASAATRSFTVSTTAPDTNITGGPQGTVNTTAASFTFTSTATGSTFECRLDTPAGNGTFAACTSPANYTTTTNGNYTFHVRAIASGNPDPSPATRTFTVDTVAPNTTIDSGPTGTITTNSPQFTFSSSEANSTFECRLDTGATPGTWQQCTSPRILGSLADGTYTFNVRATDQAGNVDASPATRTFTVDATAPDTTIDAGPTGTINNASPQFTFSSNKTGSTFECRLDGPGAATGTYVSCTSPRTLGPLADGTYTFLVRATAGTVDPTPASRTFTVDATAPDTTISSGPQGTTNSTSAAFGFTSEPGATFECRLDTPAGNGTFAACTSPQTYTTTANGAYTFHVRATDAAGNVDPTPATRSFTVDTVAPDTTITSGPQGATNVTNASFGFSSEPGATFECRLDTPAGQGTFAACTSPQAYTTAANGAYTFHVRARDAAGNVDATPATRTFTVDTAAPDTTVNTGPTGAVNTTAQAFTFSGTEAGVTFECRLDTPAGNGTFAACTSPASYTTTANGAYTFHVRAIDAAGNVDATPATRTFTVDTVAPDTTINTGPTGTINTASPEVTFSSSETGSTFECRVDGPGSTTGTYVSCTSPRTLGPLVDGTYTLLIRATDAAGNVDATPATRTFTVETSLPDTGITSGPTGPTNNASPQFAFNSTKPGSTFECRLDSAAFAPCTSPQSYTNLSQGEHTFAVRARDAAGNLDPTPATRTFTVDTAAPDTTIDSGPTGTINTNSPQFGFSSSETGSTFECRLDGPGSSTGTYANCTSPRILGSLADGTYTFLVRATDAAGNVDATPASRTFTVDTTAPNTTIDSGPTGTIGSTTATFTFSSSETGSTFECRMDSAAYAACTSPREYTGLTAGEHTFSVRAIDAAGNVDATPATRTFTVDATAPDTTITGGPTGATNNASPSFTFESSKPNSTFECRIDTAAFAACSSPQAYTNLAQGEHTFAVRAKDAAGNVDATPATRTFTVDTTAPNTTIDSGPSGTIGSTTATFTFSSSETGSTFECRMDTAAYAPCTSPREYTALTAGEHTFSVRAIDAAGNVDATPATRTFTVDTSAPDTTITGGPTGLTNNASPQFTFESSKPSSTFECKLDEAAYATCTSPQAYTSLAQGEHTFSVRAKDAAGTVDATPATRTFTVDTIAPDTTIDSGPTGTITNASPQFGFSSEPGATFECRLDGPGGQGTYVACTSPRTVGPLADGAYTFNVRARDAAGNTDATPATRTFTVDAAAPDTTITGGPSGPISETTQSFTFSASEPGATFECRLDTPAGQGTFAVCTSPKVYTEAGLGDYTFHVRAKDASGNVDATPATRSFRIETIVTPTPTPTAVSEDHQVSATVPAVLSLTLTGTAAFPPFIPGIGTDYTASLSALITSSADSAQLTVADASGVQPGRLVNGTYTLTDPLNVRAVTAAQPNPAFGAISATPRTLISYPSWIAGDAVTIGFRQTVRQTEPLLNGAYEKTLTFTLSTTQP